MRRVVNDVNALVAGPAALGWRAVFRPADRPAGAASH